MLRFLRRFFRRTMETEEYDMLDLLAYNSTKLVENLSETKDENESNLILQKYLEKVDIEQYKTKLEFKEDLDWFNVTEPLSFSESLSGKIVILDFFTYCCINCMHILPDLKKIEHKYSVEDGLVVIGVHSAKFDNEKDSSNILSAVQRHNITHPVVNDSTSSLWIDLKIKCWPTLIVLGPKANPLFIIMGEGHYDLLEKYVTSALKFYRGLGKIKNSTLPLNPSTDLIMSSNLKFPGKISCSKYTLSNENSEFFAISDTGNHRILIINTFGDLIHKIGGKKSGFCDGDFKNSKFNSPQGVTFQNENILFVADTENHAIRKIDLLCGTVETVVGTGYQGNDRIGGKIGKYQEISSPWDVIIYKTRDMDMSFHVDESCVPEKDVLMIAMAGSHQIWGLFLNGVIWWKFKKIPAMTCLAIAGNGNEENRNNSYPHNAAFAQPSGLSLDREHKDLFIADSESSSVRKLCLTDGKVMAVVGGERNPLNLFAFGDVDGKQYAAKLQHPLDVAYNPKENVLYVADTYNHKIKKIDTPTSTVTTCNIRDTNGIIFQFNEPGGLCLNSEGNVLYVADTNNHTIEVVDLKTMLTKSLKLNFNTKGQNIKVDYTLKLKSFIVKSTNGKIKLNITLNFLDGIKLSDDAPQLWNISLPNKNYSTEKSNGTVRKDGKFEIIIDTSNNNVQNEEIVSISCKLNMCAGNLCFPKIFSLNLPIIQNDIGVVSINEDVNVFISENMIYL